MPPTKKIETTQEEGPRSFARVLEGLNDGEAHRDLSDELFDLVNKLQDEADLSDELFDLVNKLQDEALARDTEVKGEPVFKVTLKVGPQGRAHEGSVSAMSETRTDASAIIEALKELHGVTVLDDDGLPDGLRGQVVVLPKGMSLVDLRPILDTRLDAPRRTKGTARHTTLASFIDAVNRFKLCDGETRLGTSVFAVDDMSQPKLLCVVDYHGFGDPQFGEHVIEYAFPLSDEWRAWSVAFASKGMSQAEFAAFLEDRITDVIEVGAVGERGQRMAESLGLSLAGSASILALSRGISIKAETRVNSITNLSTGEGKILFEEKHHDDAPGGAVKVPGGFVIGIPVVRGGPLFQVFVRIRYRLSGGAIVWSFTPHRQDAVFRAAFEEACGEVREKTGVPLFCGTPER